MKRFERHGELFVYQTESTGGRPATRNPFARIQAKGFPGAMPKLNTPIAPPVVQLILMLEPDAKKRQQEAGKEHGRGHKKTLAYQYAKVSLSGKSAAQAAQALGVGVSTVQIAQAAKLFAR